MWRPAVIFILVIMIALPIGIYFVLDEYNTTIFNNQMQGEVDMLKVIVNLTIRDLADTATALAALVRLPQPDTLFKIKHILGSVDTHYNGNFGVVRRVSAASRAAFERDMSRIYGVPLQINELAPNGVKIRSPARSHYSPIVYLSVANASTQPQLLRDLNAPTNDPVTRSAYLTSYDTGHTQLGVTQGAIVGKPVIFAVFRAPGSTDALFMSVESDLWLGNRLANVKLKMQISLKNAVIYKNTNSTPSGTIYNFILDGVTVSPWTVTMWADDHASMVMPLVLPVAIFVIGATFLCEYILQRHRYRERLELDALRRVKIVQHTGSIVMHEIRNMITVTLGLLDSDAIDLADERQDHADAVTSLEQVCVISTNYLEYQSLLAGRGITLNVSSVNPVQILKRICNSATGLNCDIMMSWSNSCDRDLQLEAYRYKEVVTNLVTNAIKHTEDHTIYVRVQLLPLYLLTEIINVYTGTIANDIFVPKFVQEDTKGLITYRDGRHDSGIWADLLQNLQLNTDVQKEVAPYLTGKSSEPIDLLDQKQLIRSRSETPPNLRSTGIGLGVSRLLARALGGDCNLEHYPLYVNQWVAIKHTLVQESIL